MRQNQRIFPAVPCVLALSPPCFGVIHQAPTRRVLSQSNQDFSKCKRRLFFIVFRFFQTKKFYSWMLGDNTKAWRT
jgi:hypothetical protein